MGMIFGAMALAALQAGLAPAPSAPAPVEVEQPPCPLDAAYDPQNPFARILRGEPSRPDRPANTGVVENGTVLILIPLDWNHPGHTLVIPRRPVRNILDMTEAEIAEIYAAIRRVAAGQRQAFGSTGFTVVQNNGRSQHVCHVHFHVIPNTPEERVTEATPERVNALAYHLRQAMPPAR